MHRAGNWWGEATIDERNGYLAGYLACALYDARKVGLNEDRWQVLEKMISQKYSTGAEPRSMPVGALALRLSAMPRPREWGGEQESGGAAEIHAEKYGFFDGEFWRQSSKDVRQGFVEGYVDCCGDESIAGARFSGTAQEHVSAISAWYGVSEDGDSMDANRSETKIPDVLRRVGARR